MCYDRVFSNFSLKTFWEPENFWFYKKFSGLVFLKSFFVAFSKDCFLGKIFCEVYELCGPCRGLRPRRGRRPRRGPARTLAKNFPRQEFFEKASKKFSEKQVHEKLFVKPNVFRVPKEFSTKRFVKTLVSQKFPGFELDFGTPIVSQFEHKFRFVEKGNTQFVHLCDVDFASAKQENTMLDGFSQEIVLHTAGTVFVTQHLAWVDESEM